MMAMILVEYPSFLKGMERYKITPGTIGTVTKYVAKYKYNDEKAGFDYIGSYISDDGTKVGGIGFYASQLRFIDEPLLTAEFDLDEIHQAEELIGQMD
jgi:hypothetical protein